MLLRKLIRDNPSWGRTRLSEEYCDRVGWLQENGRSKDRACRVALRRLEASGYLELPPPQCDTGGRPPAVLEPEDAQEIVTPVQRMPERLEVRLVESSAMSRRWNWLIAEHHYLGLPTPVGRVLRYLLYGDGVLVGAIGFTQCAWRLRARDEFLRMLELDPVEDRDRCIANNRFLILPSVSVPNLASRVLSLAMRTAIPQWTVRFQVRPLLAETFVDPTRFTGAAYRAANWKVVATTRGFSKRGSSHRQLNAPKLLLLRGADPRTHRRLCNYVESLHADVDSDTTVLPERLSRRAA